MKVKEIVKITEGTLLSGDPDTDIDVSKISTDSRSIKKGEFFIALKGRNFDGSAFVKKAVRKDAIGAIVEHTESKDVVKPGIIIIKVKDGTKALQEIAACHRLTFDIPVIAVTGSNGKTTVKDMIWSILSTKYNVLRSEGTRNNHIGVPQTLLKLNSRHDMCVLEMGTNHEGEIRLLSDMAKPDICVITNIGPSHLEFLKDLEGVYRAKIEILDGLDRKKGRVILNGDDRFLSRLKVKGLNIIKYGLDASNDFAADIETKKAGRLTFVLNNHEKFELKILGVHNIYNALAGISVAKQFGISYKAMRKALLNYKPTSMRLDPIVLNGVYIINDSYNSDPLSMKAALDVLKNYPAGSRWVVSGDMLELGTHSANYHKMIGSTIAKAGLEGLLTFGGLSKYTLNEARKHGIDRKKLWHCRSHDEIARILTRVAKKGDCILLKGSRSMKMELVLEKLRNLSLRDRNVR